MQSGGGNGRARSTQETAEGSGLLGRGDDPVEEWNKLCSKRLVQVIAPCSAQRLIIAARHRGGDEAGVAAGFDRSKATDLVRQNPPRLARPDFEGRDEKDEAEARIDRKALMTIAARDDKAAKFGRCGVVRMTFELGAKTENLAPLERAIEHGVQGMKYTEPHRHAAPEPARAGHIAHNRAGKRKGFAADGAEKPARRLPRHPVAALLARMRDGDEVVNLEGDAETVETGAEIRSGGRDAHRDLLLFQWKSPEYRHPSYGR